MDWRTRWMRAVAVVGVWLYAPGVAVQCKVFSDIFLRLIRMIVAPLILGTLVTGIAGHGSLRQVGRIGVESLVYFEVVTTLALLIGVAAINLTKAGVGLAATGVSNAPGQAGIHSYAYGVLETADSPVAHQSTEHGWQSFLLNAFPENIAKSIAEN